MVIGMKMMIAMIMMSKISPSVPNFMHSFSVSLVKGSR